jgi:hypothetical protein
MCINFDPKRGLATFWAIYKQTHLVTLRRLSFKGKMRSINFSETMPRRH